MVKMGADVRIEIVRIMGSGKCPSGFQVGRTWIVSDNLCPEGMCSWAFHSIFPSLSTLRFNGRFPWNEEPIATVCCPDADNPVVFRLTAESAK